MSLREDIRDMRMENREDFQRVHERIDALADEISHLKGSRSWVQGAWFAVGVVVAALTTLVHGCAPMQHLPDGPPGAGARWDAPPLVVVDTDMSPSCLAATAESLPFWGSAFQEPVYAAGPVARLGEVTIREATHTDANLAAQTWQHHRGARLTRAEVVLYGCEKYSPEEADKLVRHELGHALGLDDTSTTGRVMHGYIDGMGYELTELERGWVVW